MEDLFAHYCFSITNISTGGDHLEVKIAIIQFFAVLQISKAFGGIFQVFPRFSHFDVVPSWPQRHAAAIFDLVVQKLIFRPCLFPCKSRL